MAFVTLPLALPVSAPTLAADPFGRSDRHGTLLDNAQTRELFDKHLPENADPLTAQELDDHRGHKPDPENPAPSTTTVSARPGSGRSTAVDPTPASRNLRRQV